MAEISENQVKTSIFFPWGVQIHDFNFSITIWRTFLTFLEKLTIAIDSWAHFMARSTRVFWNGELSLELPILISKNLNVVASLTFRADFSSGPQNQEKWTTPSFSAGQTTPCTLISRESKFLNEQPKSIFSRNRS